MSDAAARPVTEDWCKRMGFVRRRKDPAVEAQGGSAWILERDLRFIIEVTFVDNHCYLSVEDSTSGESVLLTTEPTQADVEVLDEIGRRLHNSMKAKGPA